MADIVLDGEAIGRAGAKVYLHGVKERMRDLRPAWPGVLGVIYRNQAQVFDAEGAVDGLPKWPLNSNNPIRFHKTRDGKHNIGYLTWKRLNYPQAKVLELTGKLRRMVTGVTPNAKITPYKQRLKFGTDYRDYSLLPKRPRSNKDRLTGDLGGISDNGRGGKYPMEPREIFRITGASADEIADHIVAYVTGIPRGG